MKTQYKYIHFFHDKLSPYVKTNVYLCLNNKTGSQLGIVKWCVTWRQYCYYPDGLSLYSGSCLDDISHFMKQLKEVKA